MDLGTAELNVLEWSIVRQSILGQQRKPRRFTDNFIQDEKRQIEEYREIFREIITGLQHKTLMIDQNGQILFDRKGILGDPRVHQMLRIIRDLNIQPLTVGQRVLAIHPKTKDLRTGSLLTTDIRSYHV